MKQAIQRIVVVSIVAASFAGCMRSDERKPSQSAAKETVGTGGAPVAANPDAVRDSKNTINDVPVTKNDAGTPGTQTGPRAEDAKVESNITELGGGVVRDEKRDGKPIIGVNLNDAKITDKELKVVGGLAKLQHLSLIRTPVTDAGLKELSGLKDLETLVLTRTQVTDAGLKELEGLTSLKTLGLSGTAVTSAGLKDLRPIQTLRNLYLSDHYCPVERFRNR
jgi:Leucine-rich repeat (LRR) protein